MRQALKKNSNNKTKTKAKTKQKQCKCLATGQTAMSRNKESEKNYYTCSVKSSGTHFWLKTHISKLAYERYISKQPGSKLEMTSLNILF